MRAWTGRVVDELEVFIFEERRWISLVALRGRAESAMRVIDLEHEIWSSPEDRQTST